MFLKKGIIGRYECWYSNAKIANRNVGKVIYGLVQRKIGKLIYGRSTDISAK